MMSVDGVKLHIGSGPQAIAGWINIDNHAYPGVDHVVDVRQGLPFDDVAFVFAEHFIEHLAYNDGIEFLRRCRRVLRSDGVLRISTPSLDWVWMTQYHYGQWSRYEEQVNDCFSINRGFYGWGHQFLYNLPTLTESLHDAGFAEVTPCRYGESRHAELQGLERHEQYLDTPELPHIIVVEASGRRQEGSSLLGTMRDEFLVAVNEK